jgi:hypothetical protein
MVFVPAMPPSRSRYRDHRAEICVNSESCEVWIRIRSLAALIEPVYSCCGLVYSTPPPSEGVLRSAEKLTSRAWLCSDPSFKAQHQTDPKILCTRPREFNFLYTEKSNLSGSTIVISSPPDIISGSYSICLLLTALSERFPPSSIPGYTPEVADCTDSTRYISRSA